MDQPRSSGILLHPTSLPGRFGIGDLGDEAYDWIDFLTASNQSLWQVLPLGPTGFADSPYACLSAFAGNPLLISLERLRQVGDLSAQDLDPCPRFSDQQVDYGAVIAYKMPLLQKAVRHFMAHASSERSAEYGHFCRENASWLADFALFMAVKMHFNQVIWYEWDADETGFVGFDIALRRPEAVTNWTQRLGQEIALQQVLQFFFFEQWKSLKTYANQHGIHIVGDVPIFVAADSADVWANRDLFHLDETGRPTLVSGVPPDYFSETGQRWGNPLYRWDVMAQRGYDWWIARIKATLRMVDIIRIDHFRGFAACWEIPACEPTAVKGRWVQGPGMALFEAIEKAIGTGEEDKLPIWAEDLGVITSQVIQMRERFGFPGMKILQFAFDEDALRASFGEDAASTHWRNPFLPHNYTPNFVVYTGTHDNDTALGWFDNCTKAQQQKALAYLGHGHQGFNWAMIRAAMASVAQVAVFPLQDILGLGTQARMNLPGTTSGNWTWRCPPGVLTGDLSHKLAEMTQVYERQRQAELAPPRGSGETWSGSGLFSLAGSSPATA